MCGSSNLQAMPESEMQGLTQPAGICSERSSEKKSAQYATGTTHRCRSPPSVCHDGAGAPSELLSAQQMSWSLQRGRQHFPEASCHDGAGASSELLSAQQMSWSLHRGRQHCPSEVSGGAGLPSERLHATSSLPVHGDSTTRRLRASPTASEDHAGAPSDLLSAKLSVWSSFHRGRRHSPSEVSGSAGLPTQRIHSSTSGDVCRRRSASPPLSYEGAGVPSSLLSSRQEAWMSQRARRRCSSADSSISASSGKFQGLHSHAGSLLWELAPAGVTSKELATPRSGRHHYAPSETGTVSTMSAILSGVTASQPVASIPEECTKVRDMDTCARAWTEGAAGETGAGDMELTPGYVARWLKSICNGVPSPVLAGLRAHVVKHEIDGRMLEDILDKCEFNKLDVDHFTPVHMNRLRKAWFLDHPRPAKDDIQSEEKTCQAQSISCHDGITTPEVIAMVLDRLGPWAGFDKQAAIRELKDVFSEAVCEKANASLEALNSSTRENSSTASSPRSDTTTPWDGTF